MRTDESAARLDEVRTKIRERNECDHAARRLVVARSRVNHDNLITTFRTLRALGQVELHDLITPPGFDSLGAPTRTPKSGVSGRWRMI